jgi:hypothetical protein
MGTSERSTTRAALGNQKLHGLMGGHFELACFSFALAPARIPYNP